MIRRGVAARLGLRTPRPLATGGLVTTPKIVFNPIGCDVTKQFMNLVRAGHLRRVGGS